VEKFKLGILLHAHQPSIQYSDVLEFITNQSYLPLFQTLGESKKGQITLNVTGSLLRLWDQYGYKSIFPMVKDLIDTQKVEIAGTSAFHALLPKIPRNEAIRQIHIQEQLLKQYLNLSKPQGLFLPEMYYSPEIDSVISELNYQWMIIDESAIPEAGIKEYGFHRGLKTHQHIYESSSTPGLFVFFRDRPLSLMVAFDHLLTIDKFVDRLQEHFQGNPGYAIIAVDAETFGYHIKGNLNLLASILNHPQIDVLGVSQLLSMEYSVQKIHELISTWGVTQEDITGKRKFPRWCNPANHIHLLQWELLELATANSNHLDGLPDDLDQGLNSDQFWWASGNPCWHPEMVEKGAHLLLNSILRNSRNDEMVRHRANELYDKIIATGRKLYGDKIIQC